jgi:hypothetical protein
MLRRNGFAVIYFRYDAIAPSMGGLMRGYALRMGAPRGKFGQTRRAPG